MRTQPMELRTSGRWQPDPVRQKNADYTLEDVLNLPPDTPRVELVAGVMLVLPPTTIDHQETTLLLWRWLRANAPSQYQPVPAIGIAVAVCHTFEPDVVLRRAGGDGCRHYLTADQVVLAIEVVSPRTRARDRLSKPAEYAAAGIPFYWRVEQNPVRVYAYQIAATQTYELVANSAELLELTAPFPIKLAIAEITP